jgi:SAM-dependent methyltransferase
MNLNRERMEGYGEYLVDGYRVNYLFGLDDLCRKYVKKNFKVLELGVNNGISTEVFCRYSNSVVAVDFQKTENIERILSENKNLTFHQMRFSEFYKENTLDFDLIYIDGSHEYRDVKEDIQNSLRIIRSGGIISGHDYNSTCPGVIMAVNEMFKGIEVFDDSSWAKIIN